jgi:hypothetical protein
MTLGPGLKVKQLFRVVIYKFCIKLECLFQTFRCSTLGLLVLPMNIRLGKKILPRTNTLAYHENVLNYKQKSFITLVNIFTTFTVVI